MTTTLTQLEKLLITVTNTTHKNHPHQQTTIHLQA